MRNGQAWCRKLVELSRRIQYRYWCKSVRHPVTLAVTLLDGWITPRCAKVRHIHSVIGAFRDRTYKVLHLRFRHYLGLYRVAVASRRIRARCGTIARDAAVEHGGRHRVAIG